jgi:hypothetical protein
MLRACATPSIESGILAIFAFSNSLSFRPHVPHLCGTPLLNDCSYENRRWMNGMEPSQLSQAPSRLRNGFSFITWSCDASMPGTAHFPRTCHWHVSLNQSAILKRRSGISSVLHALSAQDFGYRSADNFQIEPERACLQILIVKLHLHRDRQFITTVNLRPAR